MDRYDEMLERARKGALQHQEVAEIVEALQEGDVEVDLYTLLYIVGLIGDRSYRYLLEKYLEWESDPMLASVSLQILCREWGDTSRYLDQVLAYVRGVAWDTDDDVRLPAINIAGEYLRSHQHAELLSGLLQIAEDRNERRLLREVAFSALARAMGRNWKQIPSAARGFDPDTQADLSVLREAKSRLVVRHG